MKFDISKYSWRIGYVATKYRGIALFTCSIIFVVLYLYVVTTLEQSIRTRESHEMSEWVTRMQEISRDVAMGNVETPLFLLKRHPNIPFVVVDENMKIVSSNLIKDNITSHPDKMRHYIRNYSQINLPIHFQYIWSDKGYTLYYGNSILLERLRWIPYMQIVVALLFLLMGYIAFRNARQKEQNLVWVGLAKETAHQLGTPISSLIGWVEYLREQNVEADVLEEMSRDLTQLTKVTDRFSKIGSDTTLSNANVNEVVERVVHYFLGRISRGVAIEHNGFAISPLYANINIVLIEWVVENLIKNAIDALQGSGTILVNMSSTENYVMIDVSDSGRGIPKNSWKKIFEPGYTTKVRGWGLGLSLSRRVIEEYHDGNIRVVSSAVGVGTTIRITLKRVYEL